MNLSPAAPRDAGTVPAHRPKKLPLLCKIIYAFAAVSAVIYLLYSRIPAFADWFNSNVSYYLREFFSLLTVAFPFSVAEFFLLLLPALLVIFILIGSLFYSETGRDTLCFIGKILSVVCAVASLFVWTFGAGYFTPTLDKKLGLEREECSAADLAATARILAGELETLEPEVTFLADGTSLMPYPISDMNGRLSDAYVAASEKYGFLRTFPSRVKPVMLSRVMSYSHVTGVYTFYTGEANINVDFPDYTIPYTAAHEMAHQRGVAREDEANFAAFLVCMESDDPYLRYSGYLSVFEYVMNALYDADRESFNEIYQTLPRTVVNEEYAYNAFFKPLQSSTISEISHFTNDTYLKIQGASEGTRSYDMVVDLTVAYYRPLFD